MKTILFVSLLCCASAVAAPNFTGEWKLNVAKSNYGGFPAPESMTRRINHQGVALSLSTAQKGAQGEVTSELLYTTDGNVCVNQAELKERDVWTLSADGKTLTIAAHITLPQQGAFDVQQVFEKQ